MAQIDTSIYGLLGRGVKSVQDYNQEAQATEAAKLGNLLNRSKIDEYQTGVQEKNALRDYLSSGANLSTPEGQQGLYRVAPTQAGGILKDQAAMLKEGAQARASNATASASEWDLRLKKANTAISDIASLGSRDEAISSLQKHLQAGDLDEGKYQSVLQTIPQDPAQFPEWRKGMLMRILDAKTQLELSKPVIQTRNTGGSTDTLAIDPMTGAVKVTNTVKNTNSPNAVLSANTSRANNRDTIAAENMRAGVNANGSVSPDMETTAKAIANGQLPAPTGMALLNPKNQRILARVMEINPEYDATTVSAKKKAASDFTSGTLGNSMRSFATAGAHLDTLGQLVDALDNGNVQVINKIGNYIGQQTGSTAPTNFDAAKDVVGKEVVKAIVAGGGGVAEREELAKRLDNAKSPAQLKGVIKTYSELMKAQHDNLLIQRRAAGLPDSTLPDYSKTSGASGDAGSATPPDIQVILNKHGGK